MWFGKSIFLLLPLKQLLNINIVELKKCFDFCSHSPQRTEAAMLTGMYKGVIRRDGTPQGTIAGVIKINFRQ
jgi:hypothetical protein